MAPACSKPPRSWPNYMPKDVAAALKKSGHWKDDDAQRAATPVARGDK